MISNLVFEPAHRFQTIFLASISNDLIITLLIYFSVVAFLIWDFSQLNEDDVEEKKYKKVLSVKKGNKFVLIDVQDINYFESNRPYTSIYTDKEMHLINQSLGKLEELLDPSQFIRVHKTTIVNKSVVAQIISRQNGDYDVILNNSTELRMSRHYRKNWESFFLTST